MSRRIGVFLSIAALQAAFAGASWAQSRILLGLKAPELSIAGRPINSPKGVSIKAALGRVVVVDFWATTCNSCQKSIIRLQRLHRNYSKQGLLVIGVSAEEEGVVEDFVRKQGTEMTYPVVIDRNKRTTAEYGVEKVPTTFLVNKEGTVVWQGTPSSLEERQITALLGIADEKAARAKKLLKVFRLKDGSTITGTKSASSGDKTQIKTIEGTSQIISTADIVSETDAPPDVQAKAAAKSKKPGKATSKADAKAAEAAAKEAEQREFKQLEQFAAKPISHVLDPGEYLKQSKRKAETVLQRANEFLKLHPKSQRVRQVRLRKADALLRLSYHHSDPARRAEATQALQRLLKPGVPADVASRAHLALACYALSKSGADKAVAHAEQAAQKATDPEVGSRAYYFLGRVHTEAGRNRQAVQAYDKLTQTYPNLDIAQRAAGKRRRLKIKGSALTDLRFVVLDNKEVDIAAYKGKVVLIDFWATWCSPCLRDMPNLKKLYAALQKQGFEIIGVSLDEDKDRLERFLRDHDITWPQCFDAKGWRNDMAVKYGVSSIPASFLVDREGMVRETDLRGSQLERAVKQLLTE